MARGFEEFSLRVIDLVAPLVPVVKPQAAFFEACGPEGMAALQRLLRKARGLGLMTVLDGKRNDIASTAAAYADAALAGVTFAGHHFHVWEADALTIKDFSEASVVLIYLSNYLNEALRPDLRKTVFVPVSCASGSKWKL